MVAAPKSDFVAAGAAPVVGVAIAEAPERPGGLDDAAAPNKLGADETGAAVELSAGLAPKRDGEDEAAGFAAPKRDGVEA